MVEITSVVKTGKKVALFSDGELLVEMPENFYKRCPHRETHQVDAQALWREQFDVQVPHAYQKAIAYLSARDTSSRAMRTYLKRHGYMEAVIDQTLEKLEAQRFIEDERYAQRVAEVLGRQGKSARLMTQKLREKGLAADVAAAAADEHHDEQQEYEKALELARRGWRKAAEDEPKIKTKQRIARSLASRGHGWDIIKRAVEAALDELEEAEE